MKNRLEVAKEFLSDTGVIFISIDDDGLAYLKVLMDEIFGIDNFIANLPTIMNLKGNNDEYAFAGTHEYTLVYAKDKEKSVFYEFPVDEDELLKDWEQDEIGLYKQGANLKSTGVNAPREKRPNLFFPVFIDNDNNVYVTHDDEEPLNYVGDLVKIYPITDNQEMSWRWSKKKFMSNNHDLIVSRQGNNVSLYKKQRPELNELPTKKT
ncbi:Type III restriction-modification system methylation subunit [Moraxella catarrhalis]|nr:Type III restriction-modification system methylation subunit [Moraxella catarrhalis]